MSNKLKKGHNLVGARGVLAVLDEDGKVIVSTCVVETIIEGMIPFSNTDIDTVLESAYGKEQKLVEKFKGRINNEYR